MEKKEYLTPQLTVVVVGTTGMLALSQGSGDADPGSVVQTKDEGDWNIWGESAPAPQQNNLP